MSEIKIVEPFMNCIKFFDTPYEFNMYYMKNKEEIDGYRITINTRCINAQKKLCSKKKKIDKIDENIELKNRIDELESEYNEIKG